MNQASSAHVSSGKISSIYRQAPPSFSIQIYEYALNNSSNSTRKLISCARDIIYLIDLADSLGCSFLYYRNFSMYKVLLLLVLIIVLRRRPK